MTSGVTTAPPSTPHRTSLTFHEAPGRLLPHLRAVKQVLFDHSLSCTSFKVAFNAVEQFTSMSSIYEGPDPWNRIENKSNPLFRAFKLMNQSTNSRLSSSMNIMHASGLAVLQELSVNTLPSQQLNEHYARVRARCTTGVISQQTPVSTAH